MTVSEKLSQGAVQIQDACTSLTDSWMQAVQDLLGSIPADPFAFFHTDVVVDQMLDLARQSFEINMDLLNKLIGATEGGAVAERIADPVPAPIELTGPVKEPPQPALREATRPVPAETYSRVSKAELQNVLSQRRLATTGTVKELRHRLIEADRKPAD